MFKGNSYFKTSKLRFWWIKPEFEFLKMFSKKKKKIKKKYKCVLNNMHTYISRKIIFKVIIKS